MDNAHENQSLPNAEEFAGQWRARAVQAATASLQHASLSQKYLEISRQFAQLAENATASSGQDDATALSTVESAAPDTSGKPRQSGTGLDSRLGPASTDGIENSTRSSTSFSDPSQSKTLPGSTGMDSKGSDSHRFQPKESRHPPRRPRTGRQRTRSVVQRVRSVKLAVARRIRIAANKDDLKPQQRQLLDEFNKSRGSIAGSLVAIGVALFVLSLISLQLDVQPPLTPIIASFADEITDVPEPLPIEIPDDESGEQQDEDTAEPVEDPEPVTEEVKEPAEIPEQETPADKSNLPEPKVTEGEVAAGTDNAAEAATVDNRSSAGRQQMLEKFGGSAASESAVQRGLEWLASVQHASGWWDFTEVGGAGDAGRMNNPIGGTAYALLPFLAAGQTHKEGNYKSQVRAGLDYLTQVGVAAPAGYDLRGVLNKGNTDSEPNEAYYVHGAATLALCEAYGMTNDRRLRVPAEAALQFLVNSQDPHGGGWRYLPHQAGSTSVTAIQLMALVAAKKAGLKVPPKTLQGVTHYLNSVQIDHAGRYGYRAGNKTFKTSATAMALLCRMYLGWGRDDGDMRQGIAILAKAGPYENLYTTYFATQVVRNWGGLEWSRWNDRMQQELLSTQVVDGPGKGSWTPRSGMHTRAGGRLLETSLATLTLEVYYRYRPVLPDDPADTGGLTDRP